MKLTSAQLLYFSVGGLIISLTVHLLSVLNIYQSGNAIIMVLTAGMLIVWLEFRAHLKSLGEADENDHPWLVIFRNCPAWMKYSAYFFITYAFINFALSVMIDSDSGYINFQVPAPKLRVLSGFWLAFYAIGVCLSLAAGKSNEKSR